MKRGHRRVPVVATGSGKPSAYAAGATAARSALESSVSGATRHCSTLAVDAIDDGGTEALAADTDGGGTSRYAEGPCTRMNLFTAVNTGLRTAMETDATAVRRTTTYMCFYPQYSL